MVIAAAASTVAVLRLRAEFGADETRLSQPGNLESIVPITPKTVVYEVFGATQARGKVSYVDEHAQPKNASFTALPWSRTITTMAPVVFANLVAQGESGSIGCRIRVNGEIQDERTASGQGAQVSCLVKAG
ncbi:membrane family protein [Segniliparus rotundus DSM 44985]|uniref:Membrane family protein n=1 Tax=Segniliparus rotundus (strain ATCC BAA-972 / CDC 1076 / CIP 108378 / DSM 44985 / JCM 13578) TaxID=640132 RepID=D6ZB20_SEGRD|nr:transport acessory protein MmpS [Segniliparus rotundus]ADG96779.1 membrane family protein [Segniliparus rotundus DSM 44985]